MARIHRPLSDRQANRVSDRRQHWELVALFGRDMVQEGEATDPADLELTAERMDAVHTAADELLANAGNTLAQRRIVLALERETRLTLCMWVMDLNLAARLASRAIREPAAVCG